MSAAPAGASSMLTRFVIHVERVALLLTRIAEGLVLVLAAVMLYEVVSRYVFGRPTLWALDVSYMLNGALLLLPAAYTLAKNVHVRVETFAHRISRRTSDRIHIVFYVVMMLPGLFTLCWIATRRAVEAWRSGEVEQMSAWGPLVWPFYTAIAVGLLGFAAQCVAEVIKHARPQPQDMTSGGAIRG